MYDVGYLLAALPVTYLGGRAAASKPRWVGWGIVLLGLGSFVFSSPHFTVGRYTPTEVDLGNTCNLTEIDEVDSETCSAGDNNLNSNYKYVFYLGQFINGLGAAPLYTLAVTYVDDSVATKTASLYLGKLT